ncbi:MAG: sulfatase-like hydrolase/transferase, partial [Acidobacteriota bacterium]
PFFLWIDLYDPHSDHDPPGPLAERFAQDPYQGEVAHVDSQIGRLLEGLRSRGLEGATHVVLAGSHGEGLGDHQETGHGIYVYEGTIRVPLIVAPAGSRSGRVVRRVVGLIDVAPTILELLSARIPASMAGRSLVPLAGPAGAAGEKSAPAPRGRAYIVEAWQPWAAYGWSPMFAVIEGRRKVILGRRLEAFDLESDPAEERPIDPVPGWARDLAALAPSASLPPGPRPVSERTRRKVLKGVRALALPWDNSPICLEKQNWPDPRDLTSLNDSLFRARLAGDHGAAGTASTIAYEVLEQDPANYTALELILFLMVRNRRHEMILEPFELFQCNYPFRGAPYHLLGHYFERSDPEKAEGALQIYRLLEPWSEEPEYDLAVHYAGRGAIDLAFRHLKRSIELGAEDLEFIRGDGRLAALRKDPRFADLVGPVGP